MGTVTASISCLVMTGLLLLFFERAPAGSQAWGQEGHTMICKIAMSLLNTTATNSINKLLPMSAHGDLSSYCSWADEVRNSAKYRWSAPLHFIDTPDHACNYSYERDCHNAAGVAGMCAAGAVNNYTAQLQTTSQTYNLTEALFFLAHIVGDIHQPLHCGFTGDLGGNTIPVHWYNLSTNLHHVWDTPIITTAEKDFYSNSLSNMEEAILANVTSVWSVEAAVWATCSEGSPPCTDAYATESIQLACQYAYLDVNGAAVTNGDHLADAYFSSRISIVQKRLGQAGVRLAAILNTIFPNP